MQQWVDQNSVVFFAVIFPVFFISIWIFAGYGVALMSGWRLLAKRFRSDQPFTGQKWGMQSAYMRWMSHYNNVLTVGADSNGLFMVPFFLFRFGHPPLFVPWVEITAQSGTQFFFIKVVELRLGATEQIPFAIRESLVARLQSAAGESWPGAERGRLVRQAPPPIR